VTTAALLNFSLKNFELFKLAAQHLLI